MRALLPVLAVAFLPGATRAAEPPTAAAAPVAVPADAQDVLGGKSPWHWRVTLRKPMVTGEAFKAAGKETDKPAGLPGDDGGLETQPPSAEWRNAGYDDSSWVRSPAPIFGRREEGRNSIALVTLRAVFDVRAPAEVRKLYLTMGYRGGAVVCLNGREVARASMPEGEVKPETSAQLYPDEAWVDAAGVALPPPVDQKPEHKERVAKRERSFGPVEIPTGALRQGINVLAVEVHRSDYHPSALTWWSFGQQHLYGRYRGWTPVGLNDLRLAAVGSGFVPNVARPAGAQVWNLDIHDRLEEIDYGAPQECLRPVRIVGVRNGVHSGAAVLSSTQTLKAPAARIGDFAQEGGAGKIPAAQVQIWYVRKGETTSYLRSGRSLWSFETLDPKAPAETAAEKNGAAILPIRITVRIPKEAPAGNYKATLAISADGIKPVEVPVCMEVLGWNAPDARDFRTHVGIYQSPTTLAECYNVPEWSEKHWELMDKSFALLAELGNRMVNIPVVDRTQFGNDEGMVYWVKKPDGTYEYDLTVFDRYVKLVKKHLGVPTFIALQIWHSGGWEVRKANQENTVTVIDSQTKARTHLQVPVFGSEESRKFWKPVLDAIREHLAKEGLEKSMCFGILSDGTAPPEVFKMFKELAPEVGWTRGCHTATGEVKPYGLPGGASVVCHEFCYGRDIKDPAKDLPRFWAMTGPGVSYLREDFDETPAYMMRLTAERALYCRTRGFGRCILDGWSFKKEIGGKARWLSMYNRWPSSSCAQREPTVVGLAQPGPDGPMNSVRLEVLREGVQEAEAAIFIGEATEAKADKLGTELAGRCRQLLAERINVCRAMTICRRLDGTQDGKGHVGAGCDWQDRSAKLYALAAEVAKTLGRK